MITAAVISLIAQGLGVLPGIVASVKAVFGHTATPDQKAALIEGAAGAVLGVAASASTGGQAETLKRAQQAMPHFHALTESYVHLAEMSGKTGEEKQAFVSGMVGNALQAWEDLSTGRQRETVEDLTPRINTAVDNTVAVLFPKGGGEFSADAAAS